MWDLCGCWTRQLGVAGSYGRVFRGRETRAATAPACEATYLYRIDRTGGEQLPRPALVCVMVLEFETRCSDGCLPISLVVHPSVTRRLGSGRVIC